MKTFAPDEMIRLHGKLVATYESASTRRYHLGRVDCIRSATPQALAWVTAMSDPQSSVRYNFTLTLTLLHSIFTPLQAQDKTRLFYQAAEYQTDVMVRNILGQGIDIHLLGLRQLARQTPCPDGLALFEDPSYSDINHFSLSTSQVSNKRRNETERDR